MCGKRVEVGKGVEVGKRVEVGKGEEAWMWEALRMEEGAWWVGEAAMTMVPHIVPAECPLLVLVARPHTPHRDRPPGWGTRPHTHLAAPPQLSAPRTIVHLRNWQTLVWVRPRQPWVLDETTCGEGSW